MTQVSKTSGKGAMADRESLKWTCQRVIHENL